MPRLLWLLSLAFLQSCAGSPVAQQLEQSFDAPEPQPAAMKVPAEEPVEAAGTVPSEPPIDLAETPAKPQPALPTTPRLPPEPYRITIRLAAADPAAPAEAVTRVLRDASVDFMVERIERVAP